MPNGKTLFDIPNIQENALLLRFNVQLRTLRLVLKPYQVSKA
jgi:hypothetical protein